MNLSTGSIIVVLIVFVIFAVKSYCKKISSGCCGAGGDDVKKIKPADRDPAHYPYEKIVRVSGMTCKNCAARVENAFNQRDGFYAKVNLSQKTADVKMKSPQDDALLKQIVSSAGYDAVSVESVK